MLFQFIHVGKSMFYLAMSVLSVLCSIVKTYGSHMLRITLIYGNHSLGGERGGSYRGTALGYSIDLYSTKSIDFIAVFLSCQCHVVYG